MKKGYILFILSSIIMLIGFFYWFQTRPHEVRKNCLKEIQVKFGKNVNTASRLKVIKINKDFRNCLVNHGLIPESLYEEPKLQPIMNNVDTGNINNLIDDLKDSIQQQNADMEYEQQRRAWCESGGGIYYGNGTCITKN